MSEKMRQLLEHYNIDPEGKVYGIGVLEKESIKNALSNYVNAAAKQQRTIIDYDEDEEEFIIRFYPMNYGGKEPEMVKLGESGTDGKPVRRMSIPTPGKQIDAPERGFEVMLLRQAEELARQYTKLLQILVEDAQKRIPKTSGEMERISEGVRTLHHIAGTLYKLNACREKHWQSEYKMDRLQTETIYDHYGLDKDRADIRSGKIESVDFAIGREEDIKKLTANMAGFGTEQSQRVIIDYDKGYGYFMVKRIRGGSTWN